MSNNDSSSSSSSSNKTIEKTLAIGCGGCAAAIGAVAIVAILMISLIAGAAGSLLGWLWGGGAPDGQPNANAAPANAPILATPTPIPQDCYVTPTPQQITVTPSTPGGTPGIGYLPTATPCPTPDNSWFTPDPNGYGVGQTGYGTNDYDIRAGRITAQQISQILRNYPLNGGPNPLAPYAANIAAFQNAYNINAGFFLAWAVQESGLCTTGISPSAIECVNIIWTAGGRCVSHNYAVGHDFCGYVSWPDAAEAWFRLMVGLYIPSGATTVSKIVYIYAPCSDNGGCSFVEHYISDVEYLVKLWNALPQPVASSNNNVPHGNPFHSPYVVTQQYGCTDFPEFYNQACDTSSGGRTQWYHRGLDIVSKDDPTIFATIDGQVIFAGWGDDGFGYRVYVQNGHYLVIYPHLSRILVRAGQSVIWGNPVGVEGTTGRSTGNHLHYEVHVDGAWVDPVQFLQTP